jgi:hypothetical protein
VLLLLPLLRMCLQGRQAEMFWPDDNMWYLIEIHRVNVIDKTATIVYRCAGACSSGQSVRFSSAGTAVLFMIPLLLHHHY